MKKLLKIVIIALVFTGLVFAFFPFGNKAVSAQNGGGQWNTEIKLSPAQYSSARESDEKLAATLQAKNVFRTLTRTSLQLSGSEGIQQLNSALFDDSSPWVDFLGGPVELTIQLPAGIEPVTINLEARLSAGYQWELIADNQALYTQDGISTFITRYHAMGAPSIQTIQLQPAAGAQTVHLIYRRSFEKNAPIHASVNLNASNLSGVIEISDPTPKIPAASINEAKNSDKVDPFSDLQSAALPTTFDWRNYNGVNYVPAVRNQGGCGSCWAFGTVAVMESAVMIGGGPLTDLSEQFLISCNIDGWSCNGGLTASKYHTDTIGKSQNVAGAVLESVKPYTSTNGTCSISLSHAYKADSWQFIVANEFTMPTVDQIKTAIYTYGPITAGVCAGSGWDYYSSGVFSTDETSQCGGETNHQIVIVGWNDATQSWILRNSWGSSWGIGGYMNIKWGTSRVGEGTSWIKYIGTGANPTTAPSPTATQTTAPNPTATWTSTAIPSATLTSTPVITATKSPTATFTSTYTRTSVPAATATRTPAVIPSSTSTQKAPTPTSRVPSPTPSQGISIPYSPDGDTFTLNPTYSWSMLGKNSSYQLLVKDVSAGTYPVNNLLVPGSYCNSSTKRCSITPPTSLLLNKNYQWQISSVGGNYSAIKSFNTMAGFNSQFLGNTTGWVERPGADWLNTSGTFNTIGLAKLVSSISYDQTFGNFTYQAKVRRVSKTGFASGLIVRGSPVFASDNDWTTAYQFLYRQDGTFSVWRGIDTKWVALKPWTYSRAILKNDWNILKVTAEGNQLLFSINNTLVWSGSDTNLTSGQVGLWMYRENVPETFDVDWATLGMSDFYSLSRRLESGQTKVTQNFDRFGKRKK